MNYTAEAYKSVQVMRELAQENPRAALGILHNAIKHLFDSPLPTADAMQVLADAYDRVYRELFPVPLCTEELARAQNAAWLDAPCR